MEKKLVIRGREITEEDINIIKDTVEKYYHKGRRHISREICCIWKWYQANGATKDMACRYIMLKLEKDGIMKLPPGRTNGNNDKKKTEKIVLEEFPLAGSIEMYPDLELRLLTKPSENQLWNRIVHSYHYQGHKVIVGKLLKYIIYINGEIAGCLGWGSAAWSIEARDKWIGWNKQTKDKSLYKIANNIRFLILPWIRIKNLATRILSTNAKRIEADWFNKYGDKIYLLETFVERDRFLGTCYKAGNWEYIGDTKGSQKSGSFHKYHGNIKKIYVYPLCKDFREKMING